MNVVREKYREPDATVRERFLTTPAEKLAMEQSEKMMEEIHLRATSIGGVLEEILQSTREHVRY